MFGYNISKIANNVDDINPKLMANVIFTLHGDNKYDAIVTMIN